MPRSISRSARMTRDHTPEAHDDDATGSNDNNASSTRRARLKSRSKSKRSSKRKRSHTSRNRDHIGTKRRHHHKETQKSKKRLNRRTRSPSTSCSASSSSGCISAQNAVTGYKPTSEPIPRPGHTTCQEPPTMLTPSGSDATYLGWFSPSGYNATNTWDGALHPALTPLTPGMVHSIWL